ncbi:MAG: tandem-95 repeat protein [Fibrobacterales bacterium]
MNYSKVAKMTYKRGFYGEIHWHIYRFYRIGYSHLGLIMEEKLSSFLKMVLLLLCVLVASTDLFAATPTSSDTTISVIEDSLYTFVSTDIFYEDGDSDPIKAVVFVTVAQNGTVTYAGDDLEAAVEVSDLTQLIYTPAADSSGQKSDTLTFRVIDSNDDVSDSTYTLFIDIEARADSSTVRDLLITLPEDGYRYLSRDSIESAFNDPDGDTPAGVLLTDIPENLSVIYGADTLATGDTLAIGQIPSVFVKPGENWHGTASIGWTAYDDSLPAKDSAWIHYTITSQNDAPYGVLSATADTVEEDSHYSSFVIDSINPQDSGEGQTIIAVTAVSGDSAMVRDIEAAWLPEEQRVIVQYKPEPDQWGVVALSVIIKDDGGTENGGCDSLKATVILTIEPEQDIPTGTDSLVTFYEDVPHQFTRSDFSYHDLDGEALTSVLITTVPSKGDFFYDVNENGVMEPLEKLHAGATLYPEDFTDLRVTYTGILHEHGDSYTTLEYRVSDGTDYSAPIELTITLLAVNDAPQAVTLPITEGIYAVGEVITGVNGIWSDSIDSDTTTIEYSYQWFITDDTLSLAIDTITLNEDTITVSIYNVGRYLSFGVYAWDNGVGVGTPYTMVQSEWKQIENFAPTISEGLLIAAPAMSEDADPVPFDLTLHGVDENGDVVLWRIAQEPYHGTLALDIDGDSVVLVYVPVENYFGSDFFEIAVFDTHGAESVSRVTVEVEPVADLPTFTSSDTLVLVDEDREETLWLHAFDGDDHEIEWEIDTQGTMGVARVSGTGTTKAVYYVPSQDTAGIDSFSVAIYNDKGRDTLWVTTEIQAVDDVPVITEGDTIEITIDEDGSPRGFALTLNATDDTPGILTWRISQHAQKGSAVVTGTGNAKNVSYTPMSNVVGDDSFMVSVTDAIGLHSTIVVVVHIAPVNDAPQLDPIGTIESDEGVAFRTVVLSPYVVDPDNSDREFIWQAISGTHVVASVASNGALTLEPLNEDWHGTDTITLIVDDSAEGRDTAFVEVVVYSVNDAPVFESAPVVLGDHEPGARLTIDKGIWNDSADGATEFLTISHTWQKGDNPYGVNVVDLGDALDFDLTESERNWYFRSIVTVTDNAEPAATTLFRTPWRKINTPPSRTGGLDTLMLHEDDTLTLVALNTYYTDPDDDMNDMNIHVVSHDHQSLAMVQVHSTTLSIIPHENIFGASPLEIKVISGSDTLMDTLHLVVEPVDDAPTPVGSYASLQRLEESAPDTILLTGSFIDIDSDSIVYSYSLNTDSVVSVVQKGDTLIVDYLEDRYGVTEVTIMATADGLTREALMVVRVIPVDDAIVALDTIPDKIVVEDAAPIVILLPDYFYNPDNITFAYGVSGCSGTLLHCSVIGDTLTITPVTDAWGIGAVTVRAGDITDDFSVTVTSVDDAPRALFGGDTLLVYEDRVPMTLALTDLYSDPDSESAVLSATVVSSTTLITATTHADSLTCVFAPDESGFGYLYVAVTAAGVTLFDTIPITVLAVDDPVTVLRTLDTLYSEEDGGPLSVPLTNLFVDKDSPMDSITYTLSFGSVVGVTAAVTEDILSLTLKEHYSGTTVVRIGVAGSPGVSVEQVVVVSPVNDTPQLEDLKIEVSEDTKVKAVISRLSAFDPDGDVLRWEILDPLSQVALYSGTDLLYVAEPLTIADGIVHDFRIAVFDSLSSDTAVVTLFVKRTNNAPVAHDTVFTITNNTDRYTRVGTIVSYDIDNDPLSYRIVGSDAFIIGRDGSIKSSRPLSDSDVYLFGVEVRDAFRADTATVTLHITDTTLQVVGETDPVNDTNSQRADTVVSKEGGARVTKREFIMLFDTLSLGTVVAYFPGIDESDSVQITGLNQMFVESNGEVVLAGTLHFGEIYYLECTYFNQDTTLVLVKELRVARAVPAPQVSDIFETVRRNSVESLRIIVRRDTEIVLKNNPQEVQIFAITGKKVKTVAVNGKDRYTISDDVSPGIYVVVIR